MAAHLEDRDIQAGIEQAWHGLTKVVPVVEFDNAFPFEIERLPLLVANDTPLEGWSFFRCSDDGKPAGVPFGQCPDGVLGPEYFLCGLQLGYLAA